MNKLNVFLGKLGGKKFVMAIAAAVAIALHQSLGINEDQVLMVAGIACTFIFGQGLADMGTRGATSSVVAAKEAEAESKIDEDLG